MSSLISKDRATVGILTKSSISGILIVAVVEIGSVNPAIPALVSSCSTITVSLSTSSGMSMLPVITPVESAPMETPVMMLLIITLPLWSSITMCRSPISRLN